MSPVTDKDPGYLRISQPEVQCQTTIALNNRDLLTFLRESNSDWKIRLFNIKKFSIFSLLTIFSEKEWDHAD
jgi:hypothetical protein